MNKGLKWISVLTTLGMFLVLIMGSLVTKTGSGQGCGNTWPLCHGQFAPLDSLESLIEYSHRAVSGVLGIMVTVQSVWAWRKLGHIRGVKAFAFGGFFFTFAQALLGAAAVVWGQSSAVLALHFGLSLTAFASVLLLTILVFEGNLLKPRKLAPISKRLRNGIWWLAIYCYVVVYLGAYIRHTKSGLACVTWPTCNGAWIPDLTIEPIAIQFVHRVAAFIFLLLVIRLAYVIAKHYRERKDLYVGSILLVVLTISQVLSGGYVVLSQLALVPALIHNTIIAALFGVICYLCFQSLSFHSSVSNDSKDKKGAIHG
ncbi:heme A synthase [Ammoniphilus sp. CFH 90114]|uniref:COX15/CtaA family protein n=1 Tax=Ammoniphilus sp. CFH 90114 TaxID=2493665 RepID=UPI00100FF11D|nr:heme A synthase [Ammoniphilus sp. CFH 90114]RXT13898.1 heme A synthase [Ammoniphilus sp. CFH 90114]